MYFSFGDQKIRRKHHKILLLDFYLGTKTYSFYYVTQTRQAKITNKKNSALS